MAGFEQLLIYYRDGKDLFSQAVEEMERRYLCAETTPLCHGMKKQGSDKGLGWHNYTLLYDILFRDRLLDISSILEIGIGTNNIDVPSNMGPEGVPGASLRAWREYFPNCTVYGADVDCRILFEEERIRTFYLDQTKPETIRNLFGALPHILFDVIIDDGLHDYQANIVALEECLIKLRPGGFYIIEDVVMTGENVARFDAYLNKSSCLLSGFFYRLPSKTNMVDNALIVLYRSEVPEA